ncbi:peroxisomal membrane protein 13-like [Populus nigra]|uniref:peroxisomal membrane protein 13-like n=1 Tax=Populus nigra TaxID=3691 RepID=UPI002B26632B|nr:peroxisomal membrane protein 13-like [Populus nigra]
MDSNSQQPGSSPPPKPWERAGTSSSGPTPFKPPSPGSTSDVVEASGTTKPGEIVPATGGNTVATANSFGRPVPTRPWEQQNAGTMYSGYNNGYGTGMYGNSYGGMYGSSYGGAGGYSGGMYGNSSYRGGYGGMYNGGMYGGGLGGGLGGPMGGYGVGMGPCGDQDPNNPFGAPPSPPSFWVSFLRVMQGVVNVFGRISFLIDQNTQAFHMFMSALLQLFDRTGLLYGELARFALRLLGIKSKPRKVQGPGPDGFPVPHNPRGNQNYIEGPKAAPSGAWDNVWGDSPSN